MNEQTFSFVNSSDDQYILSLTQDGDRFLSAHVANELQRQGVEVWGILLLRKGQKENVTSVSLLSQISNSITMFVLQHPNAILYYQCDDMDDVPMNSRKKISGISVQKYRSMLFSLMFDKQARYVPLDMVNVPIFFDFMGHETYIHIIARESHLSLVNLIKKDIKEGFEK